jgi:hypothetical protein
VAEHRGDVDDRAAAAGAQRRACLAAAGEERDEVCRDDVGEVLGRLVLRSDDAPCARVADQDVEPAEAVDRRRDKFRRETRVGDVAADGVDAIGAELVPQRGEAIHSARGDDDPGAVCCERAGKAVPEPG